MGKRVSMDIRYFLVFWWLNIFVIGILFTFPLIFNTDRDTLQYLTYKYNYPEVIFIT